MIDHKLGGRYHIERRIGKGAFGEVYRARDIQLKRHVAVKVLKDPGQDDSFKMRFLRESESMAQLMHPNIVTVFDFGEEAGCPYLVMELVDGVPLIEMLEGTGLDLAEVLKIGSQVASALAFAHDKGIVHRDLTLRNIMIDTSGRAKVLDFGLAKLVHAEIQSDPGLMIGTPTYLSPEQTLGRQVDGRADIFAFGVCFYRVLNGRFPFEAEHPAALLYLIANEEPAPFEADVPVDIQDLLLKCLEKRKENRFEDFHKVESTIALLRKQYEDSGTTISSKGVVAEAVAHRSSKRNPYLNRVMIKNPDDFFGRTREVKRIYSRLDAPHPQSISVVGDRRMGKSSLLNYIYQRSNRRSNMQNHHDAIFVYMDFQRGHDLDLSKFIDILFGMFRYEKNREFDVGSKQHTLDALKVAVEELSREGKRVIVLMDEFDAITKNPNFEMQFFSFLRFLANNYKVAYVTSSVSDLQQMCHDKEIADSPFFNIFSNLPLRPFSHEEAMALITVPSEREGVPLEPYAPRILELSGYYPFLIQIACSGVFESIVEGDGGEPDWEHVRRSFMDEALPHFLSTWEKMEAGRRDNLARIAAGKAVDRRFQHINEDLERDGYLKRSDGREYSIFSEVFRRFVLENAEAEKQKKGFFSGLLKRRG